MRCFKQNPTGVGNKGDRTKGEARIENEKTQERLNAFEASEVEETKAPLLDCTFSRHLLDTNGSRSDRTSGYRSSGKRNANKDLERMGFTRQYLISTNLRLAAANR